MAPKKKRSKKTRKRKELVSGPRPRPDGGEKTTARRDGRAKSVLWFLALAILLSVVVGSAYSNAIHSGVVHDDKFFFPGERAYTTEDLKRFFFEDTWAATGSSSGVYRPFLMLTIALDNYFHGGDAAGFHRTNVALHVCFTLILFSLLYVVLRDTSGARSPARTRFGAASAALLFGLHPIHTEAVSSIFNRSEILAGLGIFSALLLLWLLERRHLWTAWALAAVVYGIGLLFKESAATLPAAAVLMLGLLRPEKSVKQTAVRLSPVLLLLLPLGAYFVMRSVALGGEAMDGADIGVLGSDASLGLADRIATTLATTRDALRMLVFPHPLRASYADYEVSWTALSIAVHVLVLAGAAVAFKTKRWVVVFSVLFFYLAILPSSRLFTDDNIAVPLAERYLYIPAAGMTLSLAFLLAWAWRGTGRFVATACVAGLATLCGVMTFERNQDWHSNLELFEAEYAAAPNSGESLRLLTSALLKKKADDKVAELCDEHLPEHPDNPKLNNHCGAAYVRLKRFEAAEKAYQSAIDTGEIGSTPLVNLARLYLNWNRWDDAKQAFEKAVEVETNPARKHFRRGHMLVRLYPRNRAKLEAAKKEFEATLELQPRYGKAEMWLKRVNRALR